VSINKRGEIVLSRSARRLLNETNYVSLHYDPDRHCIGVKYPKLPEHFFKLRRYGREGRMRVVRASRFFKQVGIETRETLIFRHPALEPGPMLVLELRMANNSNDP
jgi:hypothetical protein